MVFCINFESKINANNNKMYISCRCLVTEDTGLNIIYSLETTYHTIQKRFLLGQ